MASAVDGGRWLSQGRMGSPPGSGGTELGKGGFEGGLQIQERFETDELDGLNHPGIADQGEFLVIFFAVFSKLHQRAQAGGVDEIDAAQVDDQGKGDALALFGDVVAELFVRIGIQLTREATDNGLVSLLAAPPQGHGQTLQFSDWSSSPGGNGGSVDMLCRARRKILGLYPLLK